MTTAAECICAYTQRCIYTHAEHTKDTTKTNIQIENTIISIETKKKTNPPKTQMRFHLYISKIRVLYSLKVINH